MQFTSNIFIALVCLLSLAIHLTWLRAKRHPLKTPAMPPVASAPSALDQAARVVNTLTSEIRAYHAEMEARTRAELAAMELRAKIAEARAAQAVPAAEVGAVIGALRTVVKDLGDAATSLGVQVKALQREAARRRVEAVVGAIEDEAVQRHDGRTIALPLKPQPAPEPDVQEDRETVKRGVPQGAPADEWDDRTRVLDTSEGSGRRAVAFMPAKRETMPITEVG